MLGMVRGLVVGLVDSGTLLHWDRARMLAKRSVEKQNSNINSGRSYSVRVQMLPNRSGQLGSQSARPQKLALRPTSVAGLTEPSRSHISERDFRGRRLSARTNP